MTETTSHGAESAWIWDCPGCRSMRSGCLLFSRPAYGIWFSSLSWLRRRTGPWLGVRSPSFCVSLASFPIWAGATISSGDVGTHADQLRVPIRMGPVPAGRGAAWRHPDHSRGGGGGPGRNLTQHFSGMPGQRWGWAVQVWGARRCRSVPGYTFACSGPVLRGI